VAGLAVAAAQVLLRSEQQKELHLIAFRLVFKRKVSRKYQI
jgi:hypothetical protein